MDQEESLYKSMSLLAAQARLIRSGISAQLMEGRSGREHTSIYRSRYAVQVCNLRGIEVSKLGIGASRIGVMQGSGRTEMDIEHHPLMKRLTKVAVRSLYTLGIDSGEAIISTYGDRQYVLEQITPLSKLREPKLTAIYKQQRANVHKVLREEEKNGIQLMMGMDPEFLLVNSSSMEVVPASEFLERVGEVGCDAVHMEGVTSYPVAELRPGPRLEPRGLLIELMHTMGSAKKLIRDRSLIWMAGGMPIPGLPLGGHLHFSGIVLTTSLLEALDNYLALPVMLLEDHTSLSRRPRYGYLGDFRRQPHGGFEYRTLPSFLVSPLVAKGVVYLAYLIVLHYKQLTLRPLHQENIHRAYYEGNRNVIRDCVEPLFRDLTSLRDYTAYAKYIDPLMVHISNGKIWDESRDIRPLWNIPVL